MKKRTQENEAKSKQLAEKEAKGDLIEELLKKSAENKVENDRLVAEKTFLASEPGQFGPFSRYVPVRHFDGTYELLTYPEYRKLKKQGKVEGRLFIEE
eukprot:CAMPEP_0113937848 /NCGR_PEP_ID=MMETSP1339-20121228/4364_1 /TAXON_ID=94617 /ORGANISM="Fibrocapsa japonica" /LENGTH=97 /DNA_ID=CAMNT_0000940755 /DNA_START=426 /DNA_END=719 /DNA_ORIENTATION=+ /assembly_acc=CAM_ASM_000762